MFERDAKKLPALVKGIPVLAEDILPTLDRENTVFVITCIYVSDVEEKLKNMGFEHIFSVFRLYKDEVFNFHPSLSASDSKKITCLKEMLYDKKSIEVLDKIIALRNARSFDYRDICEDYQYFCQDVWAMGNQEIFVDAGSFTGDTIREFQKVTRNQYLKIYAFEPDETNRTAIQKQENIMVYPYALWNKAKRINFSEGNKGSSNIKETGEAMVEARTLDLVVDDAVTFIKMDIEGAERKALAGAKRLIQEYKPKLAICVYHKYDDLWEISFYIKSLVPEYKFSLRHHHKAWFETVLYAQVK